ncbi:MAG TPA: hypothetical protein VGL53_13295 [Bryobacteraceae bacterium]
MKNPIVRISVAATLFVLAAAVLLPGLRHHKAFAQQTFPGGTYSFSAQQPSSSSTVAAAADMGVLTFDGNGNVSGSFLYVQTGNPVQPVTGQLVGTYVINADGSGTISLQSPDGAISLSMAIALTDGGKGFYLMLTSGSQVVTGSARMQ